MGLTMSLAGTFDGDDFAEVVELLSRRACTGRFVVRAPSLHSTIHLREGQAVGVDVVVAGLRDGRRDVRADLEEVFLAAIRSARGAFEFQPAESLIEAGGAAYSLPSVLAAARTRLAEWQQIERVVPSLSCIPLLREEIEAPQITLDQSQWRVLASIDGRRSASAISRRLSLEPLALCRVLVGLVSAGVVEIRGSDARPGRPEGARVSIDPASLGGSACPSEGAEEQELGSGVAPAKVSALEVPAFRLVSRPAKPALGPAPAS